MDKLHETNQQDSATMLYKGILKGIIEQESPLPKEAQMDKQARLLTRNRCIRSPYDYPATKRHLSECR